MTPLVSVQNLTVAFPLGRRLIGAPPMLKAVKNVSLNIAKGSFVGLVGESGSGKTTLGRAMLKAAPISEGHITYDDGKRRLDIAKMSKLQEREFRSQAQLIFQDPYAALSPRMTVRDIIAEPLEVLGITNTRADTDARVRDIAAKCRINLEHLRALSARIFRRSAPKDLHCTYIGLWSQICCRRRMRCRPRCINPS